MAMRANSMSGPGNYPRNQIPSTDISHILPNNNDDSLFGQYANEEDFRPPVIELSQTPNTPGPPASKQRGGGMSAEAIQMQMNMLSQQMMLLQQQQQFVAMSGNSSGLGQLTQQMQQIQQMQLNLQQQMAPQLTDHADDNSFLNEDLPNLAAQITAIPDMKS